MWVINILHWLDESRTGPAVPRLKGKVDKITEIITYVTSQVSEIPTDSLPRCWRRPGRKTCNGVLDIFLNPMTDEIFWHCNRCGDEGVISGWRGLIWDMTDIPVNGNIH